MPSSFKLISPWGVLMNESPPLSRGIASKNKFSWVGAPLEMTGMVVIDSGLSRMSCFAIAFQWDHVLAARLLRCGVLLAQDSFPCMEKDFFSTGPKMAGMRWAKSPTCQNQFPLFRMELSCHANCVSSPINMLAVMSFTT